MAETPGTAADPGKRPVSIHWPQDDTSCPHIDRIWLQVLAAFLATDPHVEGALVRRRLYVKLRTRDSRRNHVQLRRSLAAA